jgi:hypothetical protein
MLIGDMIFDRLRPRFLMRGPDKLASGCGYAHCLTEDLACCNECKSTGPHFTFCCRREGRQPVRFDG